MENLLSIETKSVAFGYKLINDWSLPKGCQLLEAAVLGPNCFWILVQGDFQSLEKLASTIDQKNTFYKDMALFKDVCSSVKQALYSLQQQKVQDYLTIVETSSLTSLLRVAHALVVEGKVRVIELTQGRGMNGQCIGYFTGLSGSEPSSLLQKKKQQGIVSHFETLSPVSLPLKDYFSIENL